MIEPASSTTSSRDWRAVACVELLTVRDGRISAIELLLDRVTFGPVNAWLAEQSSSS